MYSLCLFLIFATVVSANIGVDENVSIELVPSSNDVFESNNFTFICNASEPLNISILIDGSNNSSDKFDRIVKQSEVGDVESTFYIIKYSLLNTTYTDNGTVFMCVGLDSDMTYYNSSNFTLQVYYPPRLDRGDNITELKEIDLANEIVLLIIQVLTANPPVTSFSISYDATNTTGVNTTTTNSSGTVTFHSPMPSNRGNYTFNATNLVGSTTFTYRTFIGGVADKLNITCEQPPLTDRAIINCTAIDTSDAPATGAMISIPGLVEKYYMSFTDIPVNGLSFTVLNVSLKEVSAAEYNVYIDSANMIGNISAFSEPYYIPGLFVGVYINATNSTIIEGVNFTFMCVTPPELQQYDTTFTVLIDNLPAGSRVVSLEEAINGSQSFNFTSTSYLDDGSVFACVANGTIKSTNLSISVLYAPKYFNVIDSRLLNGTAGMLTLNMSSNPPPTTIIWLIDGVPLNNSERVSFNATQITFNTVFIDDAGNYSVFAVNEVGSGVFTFLADVLSAPIITADELMFGYDKSLFVLPITIQGNPPSHSTAWFKNGEKEELVSGNGTIVSATNITFLSLEPKDNASYTATVYNSIGMSAVTIKLGVYFGPIFTDELTNATVWSEFATGSDFTLTCKVLSSFPNVTSLNFTTSLTEPDDSDLDVIVNGSSLIELKVTEASQENRQNYSCVGGTGYTKGYTTFQTFVGGAPNGVTVNISRIKEGGNVNFYIKVFDKSDAPARNIIYTDPTTSKNKSFEIPYPLFDGLTYSLDNFLSIKEEDLGAGLTYLLVYSSNSLGDYLVTNESLISIPTNKPSPTGPGNKKEKSNGAAIAAGILVPVCVIALVVGVAVVVYYYVKNKRRSIGFAALQSMSKDSERDVTVTTYGTN